MLPEPLIQSFLVKVASRCNLNCDYCYVFHHADQSWKSLPGLMKEETVRSLGKRIADYTQEKNIQRILIVFHGGEPLLMGSSKILDSVEIIQKSLPSSIKVDFSLQTNGVLLKREDLERFESAKVGVSLSLDGPRAANDLHRLTHKGNSSFEATLEAYNLLCEYPSIFTGVISVVDARVTPQTLFDFFDPLKPPSLDFLLPDSNHVVHPPLREKDPNIYQKWLVEAFDLWMDRYPHLRVRLFDNLLSTIMGSSSGTDFFGFGDVNLLTIETDGSYHDLDVLKITENQRSHLGFNVFDHKITEALSSPKIKEHRHLLKFEGLCQTCQVCPVVEVCGGGSVPHRYDGKSFQNPTIYCQEMKTLITHAQKRLSQLLGDECDQESSLSTPLPSSFDVISYNNAGQGSKDFEQVSEHWRQISTKKFTQALEYCLEIEPSLKSTINHFLKGPQEALAKISGYPSVQLWSHILLKHQQGKEVFNLDGERIPLNPSYLIYIEKTLQPSLLKQSDLLIHPDDEGLRLPFGRQIIFDAPDPSGKSLKAVHEALAIIGTYNPHLLEEIKRISPVIQLMRDPSAHPDKLVSFSDNVVPGAVYICVHHRDQLADPYDIADSIIHEHRHQKLYLLESFSPVVSSDFPYVKSPWREELRPVSGLFHAVFVFHELEKYWSYLGAAHLPISGEAVKRARINQEMLLEGMETLSRCDLTPLGMDLLRFFQEQNSQRMAA